MDEVVEAYSKKLASMQEEFCGKLYALPQWQLDTSLPAEIRSKSVEEKVHFLLQKYTSSNPLYNLLSRDLKQLGEGKSNASLRELKSLSLDARYLEGLGLSEAQINDYMKFEAEVRLLYSQS
jgi:hypothetical protein